MKNKRVIALLLAILIAVFVMGCGLTDLFTGSSNDVVCKDLSLASDTDLPVPALSALRGRVAFLSDRDDPQGEIYLFDPASKNVVRLTNNHEAEGDLTAAPDGSALAYTVGDTLYRLDLACAASKSGCTQNDRRQLVNSVAQPDWTRWGIAVTLDFGRGLSATHFSDLAMVDPASGALTRMRLGDDDPTCGDCGIKKASQPRLNPKVTCLLYTQQSLPGSTSHLALQEFSFLINVPQVGSCPGLGVSSSALDPAWAPDGTRLAWASSEPAGVCVAKNSDPVTAPVALWTPGQDARHPTFSPDGQWLAFDSGLSGNREIYVMAVPAANTANRAGKSQLNLSNHPGKDWDPVWLP